MSAVIAKLKPLLTPATVKHSGTIIFLHGSGDTGFGVKVWLQTLFGGNDLSFPHHRIIFPTAPERPYTPVGGQISSVWFDRKQISPYAPEDTDSVEEMCGVLDELVDMEIKGGTPQDRIIMGGFSMGGAMALYYGMKYRRDLCGLFGLSAFLSEDSRVYETLESVRGSRLPPVFQCHGTTDTLVQYDWGKATSYKLQSLGTHCEFHTIQDMSHEMKAEEIDLLKKWIAEKLPPD